MANRNVEVFDNVFDQNGTANVMIVGYRYDYKDPNYQPLPKAIVARQSARQGRVMPPRSKGATRSPPRLADRCRRCCGTARATRWCSTMWVCCRSACPT
jgi:hypothetical protein